MFKRAPKLGSMLIERGLITAEDLERALETQKATHKRLGETLVGLGVLSAQSLVQAIAEQLGVNGCILRHGLIDPKVAKTLDYEDARRMRCLPMFLVGERLTIAMAEPQSLPTIDRLAQLTGAEINPVFALEDNLLEFIDKYMKSTVSVESFLTSLNESDIEVVEREAVDDGPTCAIDQMVEGSPIINLVNMAILTAVRTGASDIHIEPDKTGTRVRYRVDGVLQQLMKPPAGLHAAIVSRIKVIGKMDISEKRLPQEGRVHVVAEGRDIDLRVSTMPTILGEKVVIRILDRAKISVSLEQLGVDGPHLETLQSMLRRPHGLILVTGPTGSGKTTLLAATIRRILEDPERHDVVLTVESPIEFLYDEVAIQNSVVAQSQIGRHLPSWPRAVRNGLRRGPTTLLIGESRDNETMAATLEACLTGHLTFTTLHTTGVPATVSRMVRMFPEGQRDTAYADLIEATQLIVSQRLLPGAEGRRVAVREWLALDVNLKTALLDLPPDKTSNTLRTFVHTSGQSFKTDADQLLREGRITGAVHTEFLRSYAA